MAIALDSRWILFGQRRPQARVRLFCLPSGGGGASLYRSWMALAQPEIEVCPIQLPGRETRLAELPFSSVGPLVEALGTALLPYLDLPFALFGHSLGSLVCFELSRWLRQHFRLEPTRLFASAFRAPHLPDPDPPIHALPEPAFIDELRKFNGTPEEVLQHPELMQLLLPLLRADLTMVETYVYSPDTPLTCPLSVFGGLQDTEVSQEQLRGWRLHTSGPMKLRMIPGNHFFLYRSGPALLRCIGMDLGLRDSLGSIAR